MVDEVTTRSNLDTLEAARYLKVKPSTLNQWRWNGRGPRFCKIGRLCRYRIADLDAFLEARCVSSTSDSAGEMAHL